MNKCATSPNDTSELERLRNSHAAMVDALTKIASRKTRKGLETLGLGATEVTEPAHTLGECMEIARAALNLAKE